MDVSDWINAGALGINALVFALGFISFRHQSVESRKVQKKALENQKIEIYQTLEIQSNAVFEFEAANSAVLAAFKSHLAPTGVFTTPGMFGPDADPCEAKLVARKYYEITCNLFEVSSRLRRREIVDHEVFGSWVAWFFDTATEWGFRAAWHDLRDNYTSDLRLVFDNVVDRLIAEWDTPHAAGAFRDFDVAEIAEGVRCERPDLEVSETRLEALRREFYKDMGRTFNCEVVECWLDNIGSLDDRPEHPLAFR